MKLCLTLLVLSSLFGFTFMEEPRLRPTDLQVLTGEQWIGTLTYLDYRTNKKVSIASNLRVSQRNQNESAWLFEYEYPDEPKANSREVVTISQDGKMVNGEMLVERAEHAASELRFVTQKDGLDNNRKALFRYTYTISANNFSIQKEVRYDGAKEYIERNQYNWKR